MDKDGHQTEILFLAIGFLAAFSALTELEVYKIKREEGTVTQDDFEEVADASFSAIQEIASAGANVPGEQGSGVMFGLDAGQKYIKNIESNVGYIKKHCESSGSCPKNRDIITTEQFNSYIIGGSNFFNIKDTNNQADKSKSGGISGKQGGSSVKVDKNDKRNALQRFWDRAKSLVSKPASNKKTKSRKQ